jgi:hypothetical protein
MTKRKVPRTRKKATEQQPAAPVRDLLIVDVLDDLKSIRENVLDAAACRSTGDCAEPLLDLMLDLASLEHHVHELIGRAGVTP